LKNIRIPRVTVVLLGNENNYGSFGTETENIPKIESTIRAHALYKLLIKR
jgi:hypothetical protein